MRCLLGLLTLLYTGGFLTLLALLEWWGERSSIIGLLLFAPPVLFLLPLGLLFPLCLLLRQWRWLALQLACAALLFVAFMGWRQPKTPGAPAHSISLVTHNIGGWNREQFYRFLSARNPDIVVLQDARYRAPEIAKRLPGYLVQSRGEYVCASRLPLHEGRVLPTPAWQGRPLLARFEVVVQERPIAVYAMHFPSPRRGFLHLLGPRFLSGIAEYRDWNAGKLALCQQVLAVLAEEKLPYVLAGDLNTPDHGFIYHQLTGRMQDAFDAVGRGWGFTFPAPTQNPVALRAPWLRLDYVFTAQGIEAVECSPEEGRLSEHRAVGARLRFTGPS